MPSDISSGSRLLSFSYFVTASAAVFATPLPIAVMVTLVFLVTVSVAIDTVADVDPAGTVTLVFGATDGF